MKIGIIGASGEIGARLTQKLIDLDINYVAIGRRKGARLAKWGNKLNFALADLHDPVALKTALNGCDVIINCVIDKNPYDCEDTTVIKNIQACKNLFDIAIELNIKKFIHLSSLVVIPPKVNQYVLDHPYEFSKETDWYTRSKIETEKIALDYRSKLNISIIRPGIVYGPYLHWSRAVFSRCQRFNNIIPLDEHLLCYAIHCDDMVDLLIHFSTMTEILPEMIYAINPEKVSWKRFYQAHGQSIGLTDDYLTLIPFNEIEKALKVTNDDLNRVSLKHTTIDTCRKIYHAIPNVLKNNRLFSKALNLSKALNYGLINYTNQNTENDVKKVLYPSDFEIELYATDGIIREDQTGIKQGFNYKKNIEEGIKTTASWWTFDV